MGVQVVWFKRDLRLTDHAPLAQAASKGPILPLFVVEPGLHAGPDASARQLAFIGESLKALRSDLAVLGQPLVVRSGDVVSIFEDVRTSRGIEALFSHQETGNGWTYARDLRVAAWARAKGIPWHEFRQSGVIRKLKTRRGWAGRWNRFMATPMAVPPAALPPLPDLDPGRIPIARDLGLTPDACPGRQAGGRRAGLELLSTFLHQRGETYQRGMSSPATAFDVCSRLSAHLAHGTLSLREVYQAARRRQEALEQQEREARGLWPGAVRSFIARLHWHCHFIQKLEDEPQIEFENLHPAYDGLRDSGSSSERLEAWAKGQTGFPYLDACMRALAATGYLPFRTRAMVMSFAAYHLWLHWREPGLHLARQFTDFEAGIHWSQCQMQSATTGINLPRIYNPVKQGRDFDPEGRFIRRWIPELEAVPPAHIHKPWTWREAAAVLAGRYPEPIVDEREARSEAQTRIWAIRKGGAYREVADAIQDKHGSRRSGIPQQEGRIQAARRQERRGKQNAPGRQLTLAVD